MDLKNIKKFIELAKEEGVSELKYETKDLKIAVNFGASNIVTQAMPQINTQANPTSNVQIQKDASTANDGFHEVTSPFVGTFYGSPSPDKAEYVKVGAKISKGSTLCILEAMKIMNEIESDVSGEIVEICVENESLVEFGQTLFKVRV